MRVAVADCLTYINFPPTQVDQLTEEERGMVLAFATGCPRLPAVGGQAPAFVLHVNRHAVRHIPSLVSAPLFASLGAAV